MALGKLGARGGFGSGGALGTVQQPPTGYQFLATRDATPIDTSQIQPIAVRVV